VEFPELIKVL